MCREVILNYWVPNEPFNMNLHMILTTSLVVIAMTMALITCDLGSVFELVGATSACALAYIFPPLCYVKLSKRSWRTYVAIACVIFGFVVMAISLMQVGLLWTFYIWRILPYWTLQTIIKLTRNGGGAHVCV